MGSRALKKWFRLGPFPHLLQRCTNHNFFVWLFFTRWTSTNSESFPNNSYIKIKSINGAGVIFGCVSLDPFLSVSLFTFLELLFIVFTLSHHLTPFSGDNFNGKIGGRHPLSEIPGLTNISAPTVKAVAAAGRFPSKRETRGIQEHSDQSRYISACRCSILMLLMNHPGAAFIVELPP